MLNRFLRKSTKRNLIIQTSSKLTIRPVIVKKCRSIFWIQWNRPKEYVKITGIQRKAYLLFRMTFQEALTWNLEKTLWSFVMIVRISGSLQLIITKWLEDLHEQEDVVLAGFWCKVTIAPLKITMKKLD